MLPIEAHHHLHDHTASAGGSWFDGMGSALIGAAATIIAVVLTIRWESLARRRDALDVVVGASEKGVSDAAMLGIRWGLDDPRALDAHQVMLQTHSRLMTAATRYEPELRVLLYEAALDLTEATRSLVEAAATAEGRAKGDAGILDSMGRLRMALGQWAADADAIRFGAVTYEIVRDVTATVDETGHSDLEFPTVDPSWMDRLKRWRRNRRIRR